MEERIEDVWPDDSDDTGDGQLEDFDDFEVISAAMMYAGIPCEMRVTRSYIHVDTDSKRLIFSRHRGELRRVEDVPKSTGKRIAQEAQGEVEG